MSFVSDPLSRVWFGLFAATLLFFGGIVSPTLHSAELHLRNGDRLTGEVTHRADGKIYFRSRLAGDIVVNEEDGVVIDTVDTPVESLAGLPPAKEETPAASAAKIPVPNVPAGVKKASPPPPATAAAPSAAPNTASASKPSAPPKASRWKGKVEFGFQQQSGRLDTLNTSLRVDAEREKGRDQYKAAARALYGEQSDKTTTDRTDASFRWRHQLSARVFSQAVTSYLSDDIKSINQNYEQNIGIGYALFKRDRHVMNLGGGITGQYRDAAMIDQDFAVLGEIFEDYTYKINGRLTFLQDLLAQYSPVSQSQFTVRNNTVIRIADDVQNFRVRLNTSLQGKITERISMNLRYEYEFDNTIVDRTAKSDQRITSTLGYAF